MSKSTSTPIVQPQVSLSLRFTLRDLIELASFGVLAGFLMHQRHKKQPSNEEQYSEDLETILEEVGNPGFSSAAAAVMRLYREGKLADDISILQNKNLMGANWQRVVLPKASLERIDLRYADLREAWLVGANLREARLYSARLIGANLRGAKIAHANFYRADLRGALLNGARGGHTSFYMAHAQRAEMSSISLQHSDFSESDFHGANLQHADLRQSLMQDTNFARANLEQANLSGAKMVNTNFSEANLSGAHFDKTTILPDAKFIRHGENYTPVYDNYWTPDTDMNRYTDPHHAYFWQPAWA